MTGCLTEASSWRGDEAAAGGSTAGLPLLCGCCGTAERDGSASDVLDEAWLSESSRTGSDEPGTRKDDMLRCVARCPSVNVEDLGKDDGWVRTSRNGLRDVSLEMRHHFDCCDTVA